MDEQTAIELEVLQTVIDQIKSGLPVSDVFGTHMTPDQIKAELISSLDYVLNDVL